jgi:phosphoglycerate kinase
MFEKKDIHGKRVFVRADLNVPLHNGTIIDDTRFKALKPTIDALLKQGATIMLATHLGQPKTPTQSLSTKLLIPWFEKYGYHITFLSDFNGLNTILKQKPDIILLENLRFYPGERSSQKNEREVFAKKLAALGDYYVNDAFGLLHRQDTSITLLPTLFEPHKKALGLLVKKELSYLQPFITCNTHPFVLIIGGNKLISKLHFIESLLDSVDTIAWCPAPVFTIIKSQGGLVGRSFVEDTALIEVQKLLKLAKQKRVTCLMPTDYQVTYGNLEGPFSYITGTEIPPTAMGIAIGPETTIEYSKHIQHAQRVVYNGLMGMLNYPNTLTSTAKLFKAMADSKAVSIIAGGDSVAAAQQLNIKGVDYLSTGGGATLAYISKRLLPGLSAFDT